MVRKAHVEQEVKIHLYIVYICAWL